VGLSTPYPDIDHGALIGTMKVQGAEVDTVLPHVYDAKAADAKLAESFASGSALTTALMRMQGLRVSAVS
jgi:uroporphyrinogen-III synthase